MHKFGTTLRGALAASALFLAATPAFAGDEERALAAIAQAQGKIDAAGKLNVAPELLARAQASLRLAQEELKSGKEQKAIKDAIDAQQFADTAIGDSQQRADMSAQSQAATVSDAQAQVAGAREDAAAANARADAAQQAAASSAADAQAARNAAALAATTPQTTTVTTETVKTATPATRRAAAPKRKVVRKTTTAAPRVAERTTTTTTVTK